MSTSRHAYWMNRALVLARKGLGLVQPNPMVGAIVLDKSGRVVGRGYHEKFGSHHAEINALNKAGTQARGGELFVTLEPCNHQGKTPPCVDRIIDSGIEHVVLACIDPNPKVSGGGIEKLKRAGVNVTIGVCEDRAKKLNAVFFHSILHNQPFVRAKVAMTVDGYVGHRDRRLMLSSPSLEHITMNLRAESQAIIVGSNTVMIDDPQLNVRGKYSNRKPVRVILDTNLYTPPTAKCLRNGETWIYFDERQKNLQTWRQLSNFAKLTPISTEDGRVPATSILEDLRRKGITSVLIEGGAALLHSFAEHIHQWVIYLNSKNLRAKYPPQDLVQLRTNPLFSIDFQSVIRRDQDLVITSKPLS